MLTASRRSLATASRLPSHVITCTAGSCRRARRGIHLANVAMGADVGVAKVLGLIFPMRAGLAPDASVPT